MSSSGADLSYNGFVFRILFFLATLSLLLRHKRTPIHVVIHNGQITEFPTRRRLGLLFLLLLRLTIGQAFAL